MSACASCGTTLVPGARFCGVCGTPAPVQAAGYSSPPGGYAPSAMAQPKTPAAAERTFTGGLAFLNNVPLPAGVGFFAAGGALLALLGSILPWVSTPFGSASSWD